MKTIKDKIEDKVIDCINSGAMGRLIVFKPEDAPFGVDLAVEKKGDYKRAALYFSINGFTRLSDNATAEKEFLPDEVGAGKGFFLIFVYFDEVRQKIGDYIWVVPSLEFREMGIRFKGSLPTKGFEKPKDKFSRFLVKAEDFGKMVLSAIEKGGEFNFISREFEEKRPVNLSDLRQFLCEARRNTYAAGASPRDNPRLFSSTQLEFQKGDYNYMDVYFSGDKKFSGQEIVYLESKPVWTMNYFGDAIGLVESDFLKESLFKLSEKCRLGEICGYKKREHEYKDRGQGDVKDFFGEEEIVLGNKIIYKLDYRGGLISGNL